MKRLLSILCALSVAAGAAAVYAAEGTEYKDNDGNVFLYSENGSGITIEKCDGAKGEISVPSEIDGKKVTELGNEAFKGTDITGIDIPDTVTSIGDYCFMDCSALTSVLLPDSVTELGESVFVNCTSLKEVNIPESVTELKNSVFNSCAIVSITIPDGVERIENCAFANCTELAELDWDMTAEFVDKNAFMNTAWIEGQKSTLLFNDGELLYRYIGNESEYKIPDSVKEIAEGAFEVAGITSITLPAELGVIPNSVFYQCAKLKNVTIEEGITGIESGAFSECTALEAIEIPSSVEYIKYEAFSGCTALKAIDIPDSVKTIGEKCFKGCTALKSAKLPSGLESIGDRAFEGCDSLETVNIPSGIYASIPSKVFLGVEKLLNVTIEGEMTSALSEALLAGNWSGNSDEEFLVVDGILMGYNGSGGAVTIPEEVTEIGAKVFANKDIDSVVIPEGVTRIGASVFYGVTGITEITIPGTVTSIGEMAFSNCTNLKYITFAEGDGTLALGNSSFQFTAVTEDTLKTDGRDYINKETAFKNTAIYPDETEMPEEQTENGGELTVISDGGKLTVTVNGAAVEFPDSQPFIDENERTQIPIRAVAEALDCDVDWNEETQTVTITKDEKQIIIVIGSPLMQAGEKTVTMDTTARIVDERTYIPVRFVGEALGLEVNWQE